MPFLLPKTSVQRTSSSSVRTSVWGRCMLVVFLLCAAPLSLHASGVNIREDITFRKLTSGRCTMEVDFSSMKKFVQLLNALTEDKAPDLEEIVKAALRITQKRLEKQDGICKVRVAHDEQSMCFRIGFCFKSLKALNWAMSHLHAHASTDYTPFFTKKGHILKRMNDRSLINLVRPEQTASAPTVKGLDVSLLLKDSTYTTIYRFDTQVSRMSSKAARLSQNGKTVTLVWKVFDESSGLANIISLT